MCFGKHVVGTVTRSEFKIPTLMSQNARRENGAPPGVYSRDLVLFGPGKRK